MLRLPFAAAFLLALAACDGDAAPEPVTARDPQVAQALNDPLMTDPDLSSRNEAAAALTVDSDFTLPAIPASREEIARARAEAATIVGGAEKLVSPAEASGKAGGARTFPGLERCAPAMSRSAIWAARMPAAMPIYPRGHTIVASGADTTGCTVRSVTFETPVEVGDVMAFYFRRAAQADMSRSYARASGGHALEGSNAELHYRVFARTAGDRSVVDLLIVER